MNRISSALSELRKMEAAALEKSLLHSFHPLIKLLITIFFIVTVVSIHRYDVKKILLLGMYPVAVFALGNLALSDAWRRLRYILPLIACVGILNPLFDTQIVNVCGYGIRGGFVSLCTLFTKGVLTILATYALIASTSIEKICYALSIARIPKIIITQVLLTYRYLHLLLEEANRIVQAYELRAPSSTGIAVSEWGSLVGKFLLHSVDRAEQVYNSMVLRGFTGDFSHCGHRVKIKVSDIALCFLSMLFFVFVKLFI